MIFASVNLIKKPTLKTEEKIEEQHFNYPLILIGGLLIGAITGYIGAGGGFIIIPALIILSKLPMKMAVGTSLLIIAANSILGFLTDLFNKSIHHNYQQFDWNLLLTFTFLAIIGIFIGNGLTKKADAIKLKTGFGWFVLAMGTSILINQFF